MHDCKPYGHLALNNAPMTDEQAARAAQVTLKRYRKAIKELLAKGVARKNDHGIIYSARMVKDESAREYQASCGSLSLRNANVPRPKQLQSARDIPPDIPGGSSSAFASAFIYNKGSMLGQSATPESEKQSARSTPGYTSLNSKTEQQPQGNGEGYTPPAPPISSVPPAPRARLPWFASDAGIIAKGKAIDLPPEQGETSEHYRDRIRARLSQLQGDH
jgi:hypothetical protein